MSALLLFDQINIKRALANGTSLDHITTSGADPTVPSTPKLLDSVINGLWYMSLSLSLAIASFAIIADQWYSSYMSPTSENPQVRARIRHFRYNGLMHSHIRFFIEFLPSTLRLSLYLFFIGLVLYITPQQKEIAITIGTTILLLFTVVNLMGFYPLIYPESPYKVPETSRLYGPVIRFVRQYIPLVGDIISLLLPIDNRNAASKTFVELEMSIAGRSYIENEVDALLWLYKRSPMSADHRLVIHALPGLPADYIVRAKEAFSPYWDELRDEKERMLMDCMQLSRGMDIRWIPRDIPNIDRRIEPLLRLEILFPELRREGSSGLFGKYNLDFSNERSKNLSITLSSIDEHIQKPADQVITNALADNGVHHPLVWKNLLDCDTIDNGLFHRYPGLLTDEICDRLLINIYSPPNTPDTTALTYTCTLAEASIKYFKPDLLQSLLSRLKETHPHRDVVELEEKVMLAVKKYLEVEAVQVIFTKNSTKSQRTEVFLVILSYIRSAIFTDLSPKVLLRFYRTFALVWMASLIDGNPESCVLEPPVEWATKPFCSDILRNIHDDFVSDPPYPTAKESFPDIHSCFDSIKDAISFLLGHAFSRGVLDAYEAF